MQCITGGFLFVLVLNQLELIVIHSFFFINTFFFSAACVVCVCVFILINDFILIDKFLDLLLRILHEQSITTKVV